MIRIATRKSPLAMFQAQWVQAKIESHFDIACQLVPITTQGDAIQNKPLAEVGGKALFVKELEQALLDNKADIAVHSMKDVPAIMPEGLEVGAICERHDPADLYLSYYHADFDKLPKGAIVGTCSFRRRAQLLEKRPDLDVRAIRGNIGTRINKLKAAQYDAIVVAKAAIDRLNNVAVSLNMHTLDWMLPAVGQGAIGVEVVSNPSEQLQAVLSYLTHQPSFMCVTAERQMNAVLEGNCHSPIVSYARMEGDEIILLGKVYEVSGKQCIEASMRVPKQAYGTLGAKVAEELLSLGAKSLLDVDYADAKFDY